MEGIKSEKTEGRERVPLAWVTFGTASHEGEYVLSLEDHNAYNYIPADIESALVKELGPDWDVASRGPRIEIYYKKEYGQRNDEVVHAAIKAVLTPRGYNLEI